MQTLRQFLFKKRLSFKKRKGFTLIELLVVLGALIVISGLATWGIDAVQDASRRAATNQDMAILRDAVQAYQAMSKTGKPPTSLGDLVTGLTAAQSIDGQVHANFVKKAGWTSAASSFIDHWNNAYTYSATARTISSTNNGGTAIVYSF
ncbi:MAG: type II secretion system GspH family protein [Sporomusaceae bacterium]|jgi:prepilin-type N-terminal cleavage/methylation domain-containing protein|nr:type II secretion system GspH family protein [Sporomusaceae bacterium]